jgi:hypothetical protein
MTIGTATADKAGPARPTPEAEARHVRIRRPTPDARRRGRCPQHDVEIASSRPRGAAALLE